MKIVIYCEPVTYELTMPIPNASELRQIQYNPSFVDALTKVTNEDFVGDRTMPIMIPLAARPIDKTLQNMVLHLRMDAWLAFHDSVLQGASLTALDMKNDRKSGARNVFAIELQECTDLAASVHICYAFRAISCTTLHRSEVAGCIRSYQARVPPSELEQLLNGVHNLQREQSNSVFGREVFAPLLLFVPFPQSILKPYWTIRCLRFEVEASNSRAWINHLPPPKQFLDEYFNFGLWLSRGHLHENAPPNIKRNAWGYAQLDDGQSERPLPEQFGVVPPR
jgi:hypothetical protein